MPYTLKFEPERELAVVRLYGSVAGGEILELHKDLAHHPEWRPGYNVFWDARKTRELLVAPEDVKAFKSIYEQELVGRLGPGRTAVLVRRDLDDSVSTMLIHTAKNPLRQRKVFRSIPDAEEFLGVSLPVGDDECDSSQRAGASGRQGSPSRPGRSDS